MYIVTDAKHMFLIDTHHIKFKVTIILIPLLFSNSCMTVLVQCHMYLILARLFIQLCLTWFLVLGPHQLDVDLITELHSLTEKIRGSLA